MAIAISISIAISIAISLAVAVAVAVAVVADISMYIAMGIEYIISHEVMITLLAMSAMSALFLIVSKATILAMSAK